MIIRRNELPYSITYALFSLKGWYTTDEVSYDGPPNCPKLKAQDIDANRFSKLLKTAGPRKRVVCTGFTTPSFGIRTGMGHSTPAKTPERSVPPVTSTTRSEDDDPDPSKDHDPPEDEPIKPPSRDDDLPPGRPRKGSDDDGGGDDGGGDVASI